MPKYIIVGGVAGGATAAARLRRIDEHAEIILIEKGRYISYANCGLPYHIGGTIAERSSLLVQTPEGFGTRYAVQVRTEQEVTSIEPAKQSITIRRADGSVYNERYDKLLLSPGAIPIRPNLPGLDSLGVFTLRSVEDTDAIKAYIQTADVRRAVIIGGGFIGLEMAENLHERGIAVSIVELAQQVMAPIDYSMANIVHAHLAEQGVGLYLGRALEAIAPQPGQQALNLRLSTGETLEADLVLLSIGVVPNSQLARLAGLALGERGGIQVNEFLQTSDSNIFAVGDAIEYPHPITGKPWHNYLAGPANRQARLAADNMTGLKHRYEGSIGTAIAKVFDLTVATTGLAAKALQREGLNYRSATIHPSSHASYYPGAMPMTLKLTFDPESGRIYGAQAVGITGVDKRIDAIAEVIKMGGTLEQLMQTEQAYAPPYSSAKDPVAQVAYVAENIMLGKVEPIYWRQIDELPEDTQLIDVRTPAEFALGHIPGAVNIPVDELRQSLEHLDPQRPVVLYCAVGLRGYIASNILRQRGFASVRNLIGGYRLWRSATQSFATLAPRLMEIERRRQSLEASATEGVPTEQPQRIDASGLCCPGPIIRLKQAIDQTPIGGRIELVSTDSGFIADAKAWCQSTGNTLVSSSSDGGRYSAIVERCADCRMPEVLSTSPRAKTFILFSDDLDKALATFVLANGAAATGEKVSIFFTFWGLNAIKRKQTNIQKDVWGRLFGLMLPKDSSGLGLSKMNMGGLGARMMRMVMRKRGVDSLESLRQQAIDAGVEFIACQMSMDVMGIDRQELLPNVTIGGVATYMNRAEQAGVNLFI